MPPPVPGQAGLGLDSSGSGFSVMSCHVAWKNSQPSLKTAATWCQHDILTNFNAEFSARLQSQTPRLGPAVMRWRKPSSRQGMWKGCAKPEDSNPQKTISRLGPFLRTVVWHILWIGLVGNVLHPHKKVPNVSSPWFARKICRDTIWLRTIMQRSVPKRHELSWSPDHPQSHRDSSWPPIAAIFTLEASKVAPA